jgi:hypothetical protein
MRYPASRRRTISIKRSGRVLRRNEAEVLYVAPHRVDDAGVIDHVFLATSVFNLGVERTIRG